MKMIRGRGNRLKSQLDCTLYRHPQDTPAGVFVSSAACLNPKTNSRRPSPPKPWRSWKTTCFFRAGIFCLCLRAAAACPDRPIVPGRASQPKSSIPTCLSSILFRCAASRQMYCAVPCARRTVFEGFMMALAEKTGRRPSMAERALHHFQPGGRLFPGLDEPTLFLEETLPLLPAPSRQVLPAEDSV